MQSTLPKGIFLGFAAVAALFLGLYFVLSFYNRPSADDFYFLGAVESKGIWDTAYTAYTTWITRWSTLLFLGSVIKIFSAADSLFWFQFFTLIGFLSGSGLVLKKIIQHKYNDSFGNSLLILYAILFTAAFFLLCFSVGETWYWFTSVCMYLWPLIVFIHGLLLLTLPAKKRVTALLVICFLFIGGGSEVVALEVFLLLAIILWQQRYHVSEHLQILNRRHVQLALAALTLSLFIAWIGPGRSARQEALADSSFWERCILSVQSSAYFIFTQLPLKIHWLLFFMLPWIVLKNKLIPQKALPVTEVFKAIAKDFFLFIIFICIHFTIVVFLLHSFPPYRTWITLSLALSILCAVTGWRLGYLVVSLKAIKFISGLFIVATLVLFTHSISTQSEMAKAYATANDERMDLLKKIGGDEKMVLELKPLPPSGLLYSAEISTDTAHFTNKHLRNYLGLKIHVRKEAQ